MANLFDASRLYEILASQGMLPEWANQRPTTQGRGAYFSELNKMVASAEDRGTLAHEMTHATQSNLLEATAAAIGRKVKKTEQERQFLDAYNRLSVAAFGHPILGPDVAERNKQEYQTSSKALRGENNRYDYGYRSRPDEAQAFGVGNMSVPGKGTLPIRHKDATYATEFDILLSMYEKLPENIKKQSAQSRKDVIKSNQDFYGSQTKEMRNNYDFTDIFSNPFAPTIK
jgi:hypothetical protein